MSSLVDRIKKKREEEAALKGGADAEVVVVTKEETPGAPSQASAVLQRMEEDRRDPQAVVLMVDQIDVVKQGRQTFNNIDQLAANIERRGQMQPIVVVQTAPHRFRLISGERRLRAIRDVLQRDTILCRVVPSIESAAELRLTQLSENIQREEYEPLELAQELRAIIDEKGCSYSELAEELHTSKGWIGKKLSLLEAPQEIQEMIRDGRLAETEYYNNKAAVLAEVNNLSDQQGKELGIGGSESEDEKKGKGSVATPRTKPEGAEKSEKPKTVAIPFTDAVRIAVLFKRLAAKHGLNPIELTDEPSKKELQAILGRIIDIKEIE